jgi:hypothetical protein
MNLRDAFRAVAKFPFGGTGKEFLKNPDAISRTVTRITGRIRKIRQSLEIVTADKNITAIVGEDRERPSRGACLINTWNRVHPGSATVEDE